MEGVAYRGRVMVEIDVVLGELPVLKEERINNSDKESVQVSRVTTNNAPQL